MYPPQEGKSTTTTADAPSSPHPTVESLGPWKVFGDQGFFHLPEVASCVCASPPPPKDGDDGKGKSRNCS